MPKTPPERLAAALRANLKRRKGMAANPVPPAGPAKPDKDPLKTVENVNPLPTAKG